jgi:hypothetical protein
MAKDSVHWWINHKGLFARRVDRLWKFRLSEEDVTAGPRMGRRTDAAER